MKVSRDFRARLDKSSVEISRLQSVTNAWMKIQDSILFKIKPKELYITLLNILKENDKYN